MIIDIVKIFIPSTLCFIIGIFLTVPISGYLYRHEMWKKVAGKKTLEGADTPIFTSMHRGRETSVPKMGGAVIWLSSFATVTVLYLLMMFFPTEITQKLMFLSRNQTWVPLAALLIGGIVGLVDDYLDVGGVKDHLSGGLSLKKRLAVVAVISLLISVWFYAKLDVDSIGLPFIGDFYIGWLIIPLFMLVSLGIYSGGIIDGIDGLAGGIFAAIFASYAGIAFYQQQIDLAAFSAMIVGGILAFLWFNIPPARFYMSETGSMALTMSLAVIAFLTDSLGGGHGLIALPIIAFPLVATTMSNIIQIFSKRFFGRKVFLVAPLHHHFEARGWPPYKVTMRYWVIGTMFAIIGLIFGVMG